MIQVNNYEYIDEDQLIQKFREILTPKTGRGYSGYNKNEEKEYNELMRWFKANGYYIKQFPNVIYNQPSLNSFGSDEIRSHIRTVKNYDASDSIPWSDRRELIKDLEVIKRSDHKVFELDQDFNNIIKKISNDRAGLDNKTYNGQLETLNNSIEHLIRKGGKYITPPSDIFYDYIDNEDIKKFRNETQVFRHHHEEALEKREQWSKDKKLFYIRLGIIIVTELYINYGEKNI